jgi:CheY-like chemotaxis protein
MRSDMFHKRIVLAVDDEPAIRSLLKSALPAGGLEVLIAASGLEAIELFKRGQGDIGVVLLDLCMPGLSGIETGKRLRELDSGVPLCFMTGYYSEEVGAQLNEFRAPLLQKPFDLLALINVLTKLIKSPTVVNAH